MVSKNKLSLSKYISLGIVSLCAFSVDAYASSYPELLTSMQSRQQSLEKAQIASDSCLGER